MSSIASIEDESTLTKSIIAEEDEGVYNTVMGLKDKLNYLVNEVEAQSAVITQKDIEINHWKCRAEEEEDNQMTILTLEQKLQKANNQIKELKELLAAHKAELGSKYIEKSQHNKELIEYSAKVNYLTSENQRLNTLIMEKLETLKNREDYKTTCQTLEKQNKELEVKLEEVKEKNQRLEEIRTEDLKTIVEWREKYNELEGNFLNLNIRFEERNKEIETLRKICEEKDKKLVDLEKLEGEIIEIKKDKEKQKEALEQKIQETERMKEKIAELEKKETELEYLRERVAFTVQENGELHKRVMEKTVEAEECMTRMKEWEEKIKKIEEYEIKLSEVNKEKEELVFQLNKKGQLLDKAKAAYSKQYYDNHELVAKVEYLTQENEELKVSTIRCAEMIEELKNIVTRGEYAESRALDFGNKAV